MSVNNLQLGTIHALLKQTGTADNKRDMVYSITGGRSESTRDLTAQEAQNMISKLQAIQAAKPAVNDECDRKRKRLIGMAYGIGENADFAKAWCEKYGVFQTKKKFNEYSSTELSALIAKFEKVHKHRVKKALEFEKQK